MDNGWGTEYKRTDGSFWNYRLSTNSNSTLAGMYRFYDNVRAKVTTHLHNYDSTQGADIIVENEGYATASGTSTSTYRSKYTVSSGIYNIPLFSALDGNSTSTAYINFHSLKVTDQNGFAIYDYRPVKRLSDNKVGLYDVVNQAFYAPLFNLTAGTPIS